MTMEEPEPNPTSDHILDWTEDSASFFPSFLDDPYNSDDISGYQWWDESPDVGQDLFDYSALAAATCTVPTNPTVFNHPSPANSSKKRKASDNILSKQSLNYLSPQKNRSQRIMNADVGFAEVEEVLAVKKSVGNKKSTCKATGNNCNNGKDKEGRWAEQLLNPCAAAITEGNMSRLQHLLYVLQELASQTGDSNRRLAFHGLRALAQHISPTSICSSSSAGYNFASTDSRFFQRSLLKFYEVSPWFSFPNNIANASILQILAEEPGSSRNLHILDIGVSHGVQWPTLLEALTRRPGGPPSLVRITVIADTIENDQNKETPFSVGPPGDDVSSLLLCFAKSMNVNLQINRLNNNPLQSLSAQAINTSPDETLIVCAQFRLHHLNHNSPDERTEFLRVLRGMEPKGVILSENSTDCSCKNCGNFATGFSRRVDYLWRFLDSTSSAFKGRESEERRLMEGEAAKALTNRREMNEGKEKWCERMRGVGFVGKPFGEDAIDGARALLRKYDSNWETRAEEKDGCAGLWWKEQPVSFCSLWKLDKKTEDS